jgi:hypothetical protein
MAHLSNGFQALFRVGDSLGSLYARMPFQIKNLDLEITTAITSIGSAALVAIGINNSGTDQRFIDVSLATSLLVNGDSTAPCFRFPNNNGFSAVQALCRANFFTRRHSMVVDADMFWFGASSALPTAYWSERSFSIILEGGSFNVHFLAKLFG